LACAASTNKGIWEGARVKKELIVFRPNDWAIAKIHDTSLNGFQEKQSIRKKNEKKKRETEKDQKRQRDSINDDDKKAKTSAIPTEKKRSQEQFSSKRIVQCGGPVCLKTRWSLCFPSSQKEAPAWVYTSSRGYADVVWLVVGACVYVCV
jgi:hypothetical protein